MCCVFVRVYACVCVYASLARSTRTSTLSLTFTNCIQQDTHLKRLASPLSLHVRLPVWPSWAVATIRSVYLCVCMCVHVACYRKQHYLSRSCKSCTKSRCSPFVCVDLCNEIFLCDSYRCVHCGARNECVWFLLCFRLVHSCVWLKTLSVWSLSFLFHCTC